MSRPRSQALLHAGLVLLLGAMAAMPASEIPVPGYPAIDDPYDLGVRSAVIVFLKEHAVSIENGASDERLLHLYRGYWDARRPAPVEAPEPRPATAPVRREPVDSERENLTLQLLREYRYTNVEGKNAAELRRVLDDLKRRDVRTPSAGGTLPPADAKPGRASPPVTQATPPAASPLRAGEASPPAAAAEAAAEPRAERAVNPRNLDLPSVAELQAAVRKGDLRANLLLARRMMYGLEVRYDWPKWFALRAAFSESKAGMQQLREEIANGDEVAEFLMSEIREDLPPSAVGPDDPSADHLLAAAAAHGLPDAMYRYSGRLQTGTNEIPADPERAASMARDAADAGCSGAITSFMNNPAQTAAQRLHWQEVWRLYMARSGDPDDPETIIRMAREHGETSADVCFEQLLYLSALQGSVEAQYSLGIHYKTRNPTAEQDRKTRFWFGAAALRGHHNAMVMLATLLSKTTYDPPDPVVAFTWVVRAAQGTQPRGPEWEQLEARLTPSAVEAAFADARAWQPIPADTPLIVPPECVVAPPAKLAQWPVRR